MYRRIAAEMRAKIASGEYPVGGQLPSRRVLVDRYGCSHVTVREAMRVLERDGLLLISQGRNATVIAVPGKATVTADDGNHLVRRWTASDVLSSISQLRQHCQELIRILDQNGRLPPELLSELPFLSMEVQIMADRLHQQQLRG